MKFNLIALLFTLFSALLFASPDGESLAEEKCATCHFSSFTPERLKNITAPPLWALPKQVKALSATKEECVDFITDYTMRPDKEKMRFPQETYDRFALMPSQRGNVTDEELKAIAGYMCR